MGRHSIARLFFKAVVASAIIAAISATRAFAQDAGPAGSSAEPRGSAPAAVDSSAAATPSSETTPPAPTLSPEAPTRQGPPVAAPRRSVASLSHDLQFGLAVLFGDGYRGIFPYNTPIDCGDAKSSDNRICTNRSPIFLDVQPSFGLSDHWDFLVDVRFGLAQDFTHYHQFALMPGFRYWHDSQSQVKFFSTLQLAYDRSKQNNPPDAPHVISDSDLGVRNSNGLMVEVMRNFGVYFQFGETVGFYRWLSFMVDAGVGVQARIP